MKIAFKIEPSADKNVELHLLMEVGDEDISFLIFSKSPFKVEGLYSLSLNKNTFPTDYTNEVANFIEQNSSLSAGAFSSTNIFYNFSTSTLIPLEYFREEDKEEILAQLFVPDKMRSCFQESCRDSDIKNIYSVPTAIHNALLEKYPTAKFAHSSSFQVDKNNESVLLCIIYNASVKIIFFKEGQLQIVQYFDYVTPTDVCYHLLNVAERFETAPSSIQLNLSGMIDVDSTLYKEVYKFFLHINFAETEDINVAEGFEGLPSHFYHHLTALANANN